MNDQSNFNFDDVVRFGWLDCGGRVRQISQYSYSTEALCVVLSDFVETSGFQYGIGKLYY